MNRRILWNDRPVLTEVERAWIAACIDCEGTVTIHLPKNANGNRTIQIFIRVAMVDRQIPLRLQMLCGGSFHDHKQRGNRKQQFLWNLTAGGCRWLIPQIISHAFVKQRHLQILHEIVTNNGRHQKMDRTRLAELTKEIRILNVKGIRNL